MLRIAGGPASTPTPDEDPIAEPGAMPDQMDAASEPALAPEGEDHKAKLKQFLGVAVQHVQLLAEALSEALAACEADYGDEASPKMAGEAPVEEEEPVDEEMV